MPTLEKSEVPSNRGASVGVKKNEGKQKSQKSKTKVRRGKSIARLRRELKCRGGARVAARAGG